MFIVMNMSWQTLPQHVFDLIYSNFTIQGLKALSLVCRSWLSSIDDYWKYKIVLDGESLTTKESLDTLSRSLRYFVNLRLMDVEVEQCREIFNILKRRVNLESLSLIEYPIEDVFEILRMTGSSLKILDITLTGSENFEADEVSSYSFENLASVRKLILYFPEKGFRQVTKYMKKLQSLKIGTPNDGDIEVFRTLIEDNSTTLRKLKFQDQPFTDVEFLDNVRNLYLLDFAAGLNQTTNAHRILIANQMSLKCLRLRTSDINDGDFESLQSLDLEELKIEYSSKTLSKASLKSIWSIKSLKSLNFQGCIFNKEFLQEIIFPKPSLERLELVMCNCDDDIVRTFIRNTPKLKYLTMIMVQGQDPTFKVIQEMADLLPILENLSIQSRNLLSKDLSRNTKPFLKLKSFMFFASKIDEACFLEIKAPNLRKIDLKSVYKFTDESLTVISRNCPNIEDVSISCNKGFTDVGINECTKNLKKLRHLSCHTNGLTLKSIYSVIDNCQFLEICSFGTLQEECCARQGLEVKLKEICSLFGFSLRLEDGIYVNYALVSDNTEVKFTYKWD